MKSILKPDYYLIRYAEIALKGKNRHWFEQKLINNIKKSIQSLNLKPESRNLITIHHLHSQLLLEITHPQNPNPETRTPKPEYLSKTFGIAWFAPITISSLNLEDIIQQARAEVERFLPEPRNLKPETRTPTTFAIRVTRHDKSYPLTSRQLETKIGSAILSHFTKTHPETRNLNPEPHFKVDLSNPNFTLYIEILKDRALLYTKKIPGPGGLPVGTAGKALCLLSGGFDSVAAAYLMAKRGLQVDFLHFHIFDNPKQLQQTKIWTIAQFLSPIVHAKTLYTVACSPFQSKLKQLDKKYRSQKLILSRRFMIRTALQLAYQHGYQTLITGDSLGQVASQTLSNLSAVDEALHTLYFQRKKTTEQSGEHGPLTTFGEGSPDVSQRVSSASRRDPARSALGLAEEHSRFSGAKIQSVIPLFRPLIGFDKRDIIDLVKHIGLYDEVIKPYQDCCSLAATHPATHANLPLIHQLESSLSLTTLQPNITPLHIGSPACISCASGTADR